MLRKCKKKGDIMRADEYVVNELLSEKAKNSHLEETNIYLRQDNKELEKDLKKIRALFECKETTGGNGYQIVVHETDGTYGGTIIYCWDKENPSQEFLNWLKVLGLELPIDEPKTEELEKDPELVAEALEKAKELQADKERKDGK